MKVDLKSISDNTLSDLADLFKIFSDSTRMRLMYKLFEGPVSVGDIAEALDMSQSAISHQLRNLKENKLVKSEREGKSISLCHPKSLSYPHPNSFNFSLME